VTIHPLQKSLIRYGVFISRLNILHLLRLLFNESLEIQRVSMGGEKTDASLALSKVAVTLCNVALAHFERGEINECVEIMDEALIVRKSVLGDDRDIVCRTRENLRRMSPIDQEEHGW